MRELMVKGYLKGQEVKSKLFKVVKRQEGQGLAEYGTILVLLLVVSIPILIALGTKLRDTFTNIESNINP